MPEQMEQIENLPPVDAYLSHEEIRELLIKTHGLSIGSKDPLLMLVTIQQAFMRNHELLLERHNKAITKTMSSIMSDSVNNLHSDLAAASARFSESVHALATGNLLALVSEHQKNLVKHEEAVKLMTMLCVGCSTLFLAVLGVAIWKGI